MIGFPAVRGIAGRAMLAFMAIAVSAPGCAHLPGIGRGPMAATAGNPAATAVPAEASDARSVRDARDLSEAREQTVLNPCEPYWHTEIARILIESDSIAAAESALEAARGCDPSYAPALALTSRLWFRQGRHTEAIALLEPLRSNPKPGTASLMAGLALHYDAIERPDLAGAVLLGLSPKDLRETGSAAVYVTLRGEAPGSAHALADAAADREGRSAVNQNNLGIARLRAGDPVAARRAFLAAIERDPGLPGPYYNLAILERFYALDDAAGAKWFAEYRRRSQDDPDALAEVFSGREPGKTLAGQEEQK